MLKTFLLCSISESKRAAVAISVTLNVSNQIPGTRRMQRVAVFFIDRVCRIVKCNVNAQLGQLPIVFVTWNVIMQRAAVFDKLCLTLFDV